MATAFFSALLFSCLSSAFRTSSTSTLSATTRTATGPRPRPALTDVAGTPRLARDTPGLLSVCILESFTLTAKVVGAQAG